MFRNIKVRVGLYSLIGFLSLLVIAIGVVGLRGINKTNESIRTVYDDKLVPMQLVYDINGLQRGNIRELLLALSHDPVLAAHKIHEEDHPMTKHTDIVEANVGKINRTWEQFMSTRLTDEEKKFTGSFVEKREKFVNDGLMPAISLLKERKFADANLFISTKTIPLYEQAEEDFEALVKLQKDIAKEEKDRMDASYVFARNLAISSMVGGILLAFVIGYWLIRSISTRVSEGVSALSSTSTEIASTVEQHERAAAQQAASVSETTTTTDELSASSRQSAEQADAVADLARQALATTEEGVKMAADASEGMSKTKEKVGAIGEQILHLSEQTGQIGGIAAVVTDIASQINMLALNAAVEAVRAGEQGRGFAVIAQEVRKLADQGKKSAERVNAIVTEIQKATNSAVMVTEEGTKTVQEVAGLALRAGEAFSSLSAVANGVYENARQVSLNAKQQVTAIKQVTEAMNLINAGAKETAAGISQTKVGMGRLNEAAQELKKMM